jgi:hypothetical protein
MDLKHLRDRDPDGLVTTVVASRGAFERDDRVRRQLVREFRALLQECFHQLEDLLQVHGRSQLAECGIRGIRRDPVGPRSFEKGGLEHQRPAAAFILNDAQVPSMVDGRGAGTRLRLRASSFALRFRLSTHSGPAELEHGSRRLDRRAIPKAVSAVGNDGHLGLPLLEGSPLVLQSAARRFAARFWDLPELARDGEHPRRDPWFSSNIPGDGGRVPGGDRSFRDTAHEPTCPWRCPAA